MARPRLATRSISTTSPRRWCGASWATAFGSRRSSRLLLAGVEALGVDLVRVADRGGARARLAGARRAEKYQAFRIAPVDAALGDDPVHRDIPALRVNGLQLAQLVAHADDDALGRQAR